MRALVVVALLLAPSLALADDGLPVDCARARKAGKVCVIDFSDFDPPPPDPPPPPEPPPPPPQPLRLDSRGGLIAYYELTSFLLRIRQDFIPQIVESVEDAE